ncbi:MULTISPECIES: nucleoside hydrolase [Bifidobacterium]|uniref:nucleoside hydrolase n=1 Tax=Bifidobacterium TaxID=1678 RepID=UPI0018DC445E|nr:nucleoside hydrolase [uncultured Bifidobacterium sp.]MBI0047876.1 nucleoside hydrolase [Bifidobacterium choladohabitans]MBI0147182.1 nucleoside hydrolase [Bifidobacterium sp. W8104]MBI0150964.1 nucleoside hydrolase [Bifidobacterium sp. M0353]MBI0089754.1 nucleoside hydrolase [Bifidobacterium choladohabitans]MBI0141799.1 nucleoside hydrolase [Bifidobacterium choladohabitans]
MSASKGTVRKIILDLDTGIDDTLALSYVLGSPDAELIGITGTYGNVVLDQGVDNDLRLLAMYGREDIPVFKGIDHPSTADSFSVPPDSEIFHGANGTGNIEIPAQTDRQASQQSSVDFIIDAVRRYPKGELVVVPTGALTTIAAALEKAPDIVDRISIVMMGGTLTQPGNVGPFAEANINQDPEAANRVFATTADITMVGLDVTTQALMSREDTEALRATGTSAGRFLADMTDYYIDISEKESGAYLGGCNLHDPLAAAVAIDPSLVTTFATNLMVETEGPQRARTIGDPNRLLDTVKNTKVALSVDTERFTRRFMDRLLTLVRKTESEQ